MGVNMEQKNRKNSVPGVMLSLSVYARTSSIKRVAFSIVRAIKSSFDSCSVFLLNSKCHLPRPQKATVLAVNECLYGRDVAPLGPTIRKANLWNQVAPGDFHPEVDKSP